ncbi:TetR/AcrR family transcriptional regulator [Plantibacter sp. VKM Ac-2876]|uniref:TetR/AcrR family transcriptional regulator n=1 Tax=Plantibacter sp. VKM Ac-2876 TaxID=2783826 RepID=UPI001889E223|nr:TetR/AcrR family transcriptional regulator [Plantibacter sp. VKM Ac-2876]MBF4564446.1 TetR/AcrR family transcriptional regulator [Plantibacter sp. VKM Ac-2876]
MEPTTDDSLRSAPRRRLSWDARHAQLLDAFRDLIRTHDLSDVTLARVAAHAGVTKPVAYDHFGDLSGLLSEVYRAFESHQRDALGAVLAGAPLDLTAVADLVAEAYIGCCIAEGMELAAVVSALRGSTTLNALRSEAELAYLEICREALEPWTGAIDPAPLSAIPGAGDALARSILSGTLSTARASVTLAEVVRAVAVAAAVPGSAGELAT